MRKSIGVVNEIANCDDCWKSFNNYKNGQALAAQHAKKYGHTVNGEVGLAFKYEGKT